MPTKIVADLIAEIKHIQNNLTEARTDLMWMKRIIIAAAGLGFAEKILQFVLRP